MLWQESTGFWQNGAPVGTGAEVLTEVVELLESVVEELASVVELLACEVVVEVLDAIVVLLATVVVVVLTATEVLVVVVVVVGAAEVEETIQLQAEETRLATFPVHAAAANEGMAFVAVTMAVVKVPQKA